MLDKTFYILRYILVEEEQRNMLAKPLPVPKGYAIYDALSKLGADRFFTYYGATYSFVGFHHPDRNKRFLFGKVAKRRQMDLGEYEPGDIRRDSHDDWVPILCLVDCETQHVMIEKKAKFSRPEQLLSVMTKGLNEVIPSLYNCQAFVKGKTSKNKFWELVSESQSIFCLELKLLSTNLFDANVSASESLDALKALFAQDSLSISLKNELGHLKVPKEHIDNYIDYIAEGEGEWKLVRGLNGRKKAYSSTDNIKTIDATVGDNDADILSPEDVSKIMMNNLLKFLDKHNDE